MSSKYCRLPAFSWEQYTAHSSAELHGFGILSKIRYSLGTGPADMFQAAPGMVESLYTPFVCCYALVHDADNLLLRDPAYGKPFVLQAVPGWLPAFNTQGILP